jgi:Putative MetA-pathway of phenol degradation
MSPEPARVCSAILLTVIAAAARAEDGPTETLAAALARASAATAHHGPGTSGGGSSTISGETLKAGSWDLDLRADYTKFRRFDRAAAEAHAATAGEFDAVEQSLVTSLSAAYGLTDDVQLGATIGWYRAENFIAAERDEETGMVESGEADPDGITDLWLTAKARLLRGRAGNLAAQGGIKLPTGRDDVRLDNGELLEPSSQPGSGSVDFQAGLAYSRFLTDRITIDASGLYTFRTRHEGFKVGDRVDLGTALAYRLTEDIDHFPQWSLFGEASLIHLLKDEPEEGPNPNTGGTTLFLTPGARVRFAPAVALTVAPSFPVWQDLNGDQDKTEVKVAVTVSVSF